MPKKLTDQYFTSLVNLIGSFPQGVRISELIAAIDNPPPQRTLQYHLSKLMKQQRVTATGKGVARRYHLPVSLENATIGQHQLNRKIGSE